MHDFPFPPFGNPPENIRNQPAPAAPPAAKCRARILVMDDEKSILELTTRMLTCQGFEVETALNGTTAVAQYKAAREAGNPFDAVLMDLTVPAGMGGFEAFEAMREIDPGVRAILSSGYSHEPVILNYKAHGIAAVAPKPYHMSELITVVQSALAH